MYNMHIAYFWWVFSMGNIVSSVRSGEQVSEKLVNVSVNADLLRKAEALKINLSAMLEQALAT